MMFAHPFSWESKCLCGTLYGALPKRSLDIDVKLTTAEAKVSAVAMGQLSFSWPLVAVIMKMHILFLGP